MNGLFLITVSSVVGLGLFFGLILAVAEKKFEVETDQRFEELKNILPGANCGGCGYTGCGIFAQALLDGDADIDGCPAGGSEVQEQIAQVLGVENKTDTRTQVACIMCQGGKKEVEEISEYQGISSCLGAELIEGGHKECLDGCLGLGDCVKVCPFDAVMIDERGIAAVDKELCTGCGQCVEVCPRNIIDLIDSEDLVQVRCVSQTKGKRVRKICEVACIGCGLCEKECPFDAITVDNNLAEIDYKLCKNCGLCAKKCPTDAIMNEKIKD